jgi:molecular chaperone DnaK
MPTPVGIDLGTTNSAIAYVDEYGKPIVIANDEGSNITPSVVYFDNSEVIVGDEAKELQALGTYDVVAFFKRQMGDEYFIFEVDGKDYDAVDLSALVLKKLKEDAETALGETIKDAVITVPAYFKEKERSATIEAGKRAGLNVLQVINEPTAAAVAYGLKQQNTSQTIIVYDLGGGTFDVTIMKIDSESISVLNSVGDHQLGGKDWDEAIVSYVANAFKDEFGEDPIEDAESIADLMTRVEEAKKKLSSVEKTTIVLSYNGNKGRYTIDRNTFEDITRNLMERTVLLTEQSIEDIGLSFSDIDGILLVGGSTRMPMVHTFIKERFGTEPLSGINVDEAVALGAALVAQEKSTSKQKGASYALPRMRVVKDVTNHTLGMIAINDDNTAYVNSFILPKNREIPCTEERTFNQRVGKKNENITEVFVTQGEHRSQADVSYLGKYVIKDIPYVQGGNAEVAVAYTYDDSGTVHVNARLSTGEVLRVEKEDLPDDVPDRFMRAPEPEPVELEPEFTTVYLAFDISGSMRGKPLKKAKEAARSFVENMNLEYSAVGLIVFSDQVKISIKATHHENDILEVIEQIKSGGGSEIHPFNEINKLLQNVNNRKFVVILTDGAWCHQNKAIKQAKVCHSNGIEIAAIGFGGADQRFLKAIASTDKGSIFTTTGGLVEAFSTIAKEIGFVTKSGVLQRDNRRN